jgi:hypothetical protein
MIYSKPSEKSLDRLSWKPENLYTKWDLSNFYFIWIKVLDDVVTESKLWPDDDVMTLRGGSYSFTEVADIEDRELIYTITLIE